MSPDGVRSSVPDVSLGSSYSRVQSVISRSYFLLLCSELSCSATRPPCPSATASSSSLAPQFMQSR